MLREQEVMQILNHTGAYREGHFRLTSGLHTNVFLLCSMVQQYPEHTARLAQAMAEPFRVQQVDVVVGTAVGGVILAYEVARALGARAIFAEKSGTGAMVLRRGFALRPGERALVVEDAVTTGGSIRKVMATVAGHGAEVAGVTVLVDRSSGKVDVGAPLMALVTMDVPSWEPASCPLCASGVPLVLPKEAEAG